MAMNRRGFAKKLFFMTAGGVLAPKALAVVLEEEERKTIISVGDFDHGVRLGRDVEIDWYYDAAAAQYRVYPERVIAPLPIHSWGWDLARRTNSGHVITRTADGTLYVAMRYDPATKRWIETHYKDPGTADGF